MGPTPTLPKDEVILSDMTAEDGSDSIRLKQEKSNEPHGRTLDSS